MSENHADLLANDFNAIRTAHTTEEVEQMINECFCQIDKDGNGFIT